MDNIYNVNSHQWFRVIDAKHYVKKFASDRHHMLKQDGSTYQMPPPSYPPIRTANEKHNLDKFWTCNFSEIFTTATSEDDKKLLKSDVSKVTEIIKKKSAENYGICLSKSEFYNFIVVGR